MLGTRSKQGRQISHSLLPPLFPCLRYPSAQNPKSLSDLNGIVSQLASAPIPFNYKLITGNTRSVCKQTATRDASACCTLC